MSKMKDDITNLNEFVDEHDAKIQMYRSILHGLNESTDEYLYVRDLRDGLYYFYGGLEKKYDVKPICTVSDWGKIVYPSDLPALESDLESILSGKSSLHCMDYRIFDRDGNKVWINCRGTVQYDENKNPVAFIGRVSDTIYKHKVDSLTGVFNKNKMSEILTEVLEKKSEGTLITIAVDNLKDINIQYGRKFGDKLLKKLAEILEDVSCDPYHVGRLDGDTFGIRVDTANTDEVKAVFEQIQLGIKEYCTVSGGAVAYNDLLLNDTETLYQYAEMALDNSKKNGKNMLSFFSISDYTNHVKELELIEELQYSVKHNFEGFSLNFQPQVGSGKYSLFGAEALVRFESPKRGRVFPDEFIPILEYTGLIRPVGIWILKTALAHCKKWRESIPDFHISVNMSYVQLKQEGITEAVLEELYYSGLPGNALTLEVTEGMQLQEFEYFNKIFYKWKKAGIEISVDDFGTGYSNLSYLKSLNFDEIKIDRCFVSGVQHSEYNYRLISNMVELAKSSNIRICFEGVELEDELKVLEDLRPDIYQGYLFAKPCEDEQFEQLYLDKVTESETPWSKFIHTKDNAIDVIDAKLSLIQNLEKLIESIDEVLYVSDTHTYELYYMNFEARSVTGVYDYKGKKCYEVLRGRKTPCDYCDKSCLCHDKFYTYPMVVSHWDKNILMKHKLMYWNGKEAHLQIAVDLDKDRETREN